MLLGLSSFLPETALSLFDNLEFLIRLVLSGIFGAVVGLERTKRQKEAGVRTHCIVAVTSAAFMILSKYAFLDLAAPGAFGTDGADPSRIASQVVTGISFIGAGVIFRNKNLSITGLTTAAGLWATSAIGMTIGAGLYWVGTFETLALMVVQVVFHRHPVGNDAKVIQEIEVRLEDSESAVEAFQYFVEIYDGETVSSSLLREDGGLYMKARVRLEEPIPYQAAAEFMRRRKEIFEIRV